MITNIENNLSKQLSKINNISTYLGKLLSKYRHEEEAESILIYSIEGVLNFMLWVLTLLIISLSINTVKTTFTVFIIYLILRSSFGGAHAKTQARCFLLSVLFPAMLGYIAVRVNMNLLVIIGIYIFAYTTSITVGVIDNSRKLLSIEQKANFKKRGIISLILIAIIHTFIITDTLVSNSISFGIFIAFINLYFGKNNG